MKAVVYARYSSDQQSNSSIEDQVEVCRRYISQQGWLLTQVYSDAAISGATILRPGYQQLLEDARGGSFDVIVAEALDRLSRDQEDVAGLYKQLSFALVKLITLAEGEISELHVGLKGTMNALYLKDLAQKTRRGLEGRVRQGRSGGGNAYGYDVVRELTANGSSDPGKRRINPEQAAIVHRIFEQFASGLSPKVIAHTLNREHIPGPSGRTWGPSTIHGNWRRGTGILNNELYVGRLVWNRQSFVKDPSTGKRQARLNPTNKWIIQEVPHLRIIEDTLWDRVKDRQLRTRSRIIKNSGSIHSECARRPRYLLSGLIKCGLCGGGYSMSGAHRYGCSTAGNKGTCTNRLTIRRDELEAKVLDGIRRELMQPELVNEFIDEFHREVNRLAAERDFERDRLVSDLDKTDRHLRKIVQAIKDGVPALTLKDELMVLEAKKTELQQQIASAPAPTPRLHPNLSELYRQKVTSLHKALNSEDTRTEATEVLRGLIDEIKLVPENEELKIELYGQLAAMLALANESPRSMNRGLQLTLVAGEDYKTGGVDALYSRKRTVGRKAENEEIKKVVFSTLHEPPSNHGINRTTWKRDDFIQVLAQKGVVIGKDTVRQITKEAGFKWRKARIVLTSNDPEYREKLQRVQDVLRNLQADEAFFSIDEFGPFAVKMKGGQKLVGPAENFTVPQWQKSKGRLIMTAALELSGNQVVHFYSNKKNTDEMIRMMDILIKRYRGFRKLWLSWDAASWHMSKKLYEQIEAANVMAYITGSPNVDTAPLPAGAQFLNVIESVFSGLARGVIHNSDYKSVDEAKAAIDRYFEERNEHFERNPKRAGKKIWGEERVVSEFHEANNCKDPRYR